MKKFIFAAFAFLALLTTPALADSEIGIVNVGKIMQTSKVAVSVRDQLQAKQKTFQSELDSKQKALVAEDQALVKQKETTDKAAFEKKVKAFQEKALAAQQEVKVKKESLDKAYANALEEIKKNLIEITKQVATEKKITAVISSDQILYGDPSLDLTDEVLKKLDVKLPNISVKL